MKRKRILFFFPHPAADDLDAIRRGTVPSERLYGVPELKARGWDIETCEERFASPTWNKIADQLRQRGFNPINFRSIVKMAAYDVIMVKDDFSLLLTICARLMGKRLIYLDSVFAVPHRRWRQWLLYLNMRLAPVVVCYSRYQVAFWTRFFGLSPDKFRSVPNTLDVPFYFNKAALCSEDVVGGEDYVLSIGRDLGRDFETLVCAARMAGLKVKLVTLPYLIPKSARDAADVEILQRIPYEELFRLYAGARMTVISLKANIDYGSGIRAAMEALAVGRALISTRSEILVEHIPFESEAVLYVEPGDVEGMRDAMLKLRNDSGLRTRLERNGMALIASRYGTEVVADKLDALLKEV